MTQGRTQGGAAQGLSGRTSVTAQQQSAIQQSVLSARNVPRVDASNINFPVNVGAVVPASFGFASVAAYPVLLDTFPAYRDDRFFVVDDEIFVVDGSRRIVDVVPAGPRTHFAEGGVSGGGSAALNLPPEEIREVQQVLVERGFLNGAVDGVLGPETRDALIAFQRQQGIQATGSIDSRTVSDLGLSTNRIGGQGASQGQSTVGQGQAGPQQPGPQTTTGQASPSPQTTGQASPGQSAGQPGAPSRQTTGQAGQGAGSPQRSTTDQGTAPAQQNTTGQAPAPSASGHGGAQAPAPNPAQNPNRK